MIVIQVIGETSNKSTELKKFCQTFVLASQPSGYFVLNDIFRYIIDESEAEVENGEATEESGVQEVAMEDVKMPDAAPVEEPKELDTDIVSKKLEDSVEPAVLKEEPATNGDAVQDVDEAEEAPAAATKPEAAITPEAVEKEVEEEGLKEAEKPKDPVTTPAAVSRVNSTTKPTQAAPAVPAGPPKPMSWAARAAASGARVAVPAVAPAATKSTAPAQSRAPAAQQPSAAAPAKADPATAAKEAAPTPPAQNDEWQSVGDGAKRQNRPQSISTPPEKEGALGYVKNVSEKIQADDLKAHLSKFGELVYFDVNRTKVRQSS